MGRTCSTTALSLSATHLSRIATSSAFCCGAVRPFFEGQSMLDTVATQTPRNSRATGGGSSARAAAKDRTSADMQRKRGMQTSVEPDTTNEELILRRVL